MRGYQVVWWTSAGLAVLVGVAVAVATSSAFLSFTLFVPIATCTGILAGNLHLLADMPPPPRRILVRRVTAHAVATGSAAVACFGLGTVLGAGMLVILGLLAISSPPVAKWAITRHATDDDLVSESARLPIRSAGDMSAWTDAELYTVWCASLDEVGQAPDRAVVAAQARAYLLEELERRHPADAAFWIRSGAGLEGEPPHFLVEEDHRP